MKYEYNKSAIRFSRDEGKSTVVMTEKNIQLFLNSTGKYVLSNLDKLNDTEELVQMVREKYPDVDLQTIEDDVNEIIRLFEIYGIVVLNNNENKGEEKQIGIAGDLQFKQLSVFIKDCLKKEKNHKALMNDDLYSPLFLRANTMQNREYYAYCMNDNEISGCISFSGETYRNSNVLTITHYYSKKDSMDKDIFSNLTQYALEQTRKRYSVSKVRVSLIKNDNQESGLEKMIKELDYKVECVLKNETNQGDVIFYTLFL